MNMKRTWATRAQWAFLVGTGLLVCACSGRHHSDGPEPIAECQQYEQAASRCMGRPLALPYAAAPVGKSEQEIAQLRQLCATNLQRLKEACR